MLNKKWWEKEPLRIFEICSAFKESDLGIKNPSTIKKIGENVQHKYCMLQDGGLDDKKLFF